jgi:uncharacterized membrane protein YoaK (UPF0700 family)
MNRKIKGATIALYAVCVFLFGVLAYKIFDHEILAYRAVNILTIIVLVALCILVWLAGWSSRNDK